MEKKYTRLTIQPPIRLVDFSNPKWALGPTWGANVAERDWVVTWEITYSATVLMGEYFQYTNTHNTQS